MGTANPAYFFVVAQNLMPFKQILVELFVTHRFYIEGGRGRKALPFVRSVCCSEGEVFFFIDTFQNPNYFFVADASPIGSQTMCTFLPSALLASDFYKTLVYSSVRLSEES